MPLLEQLVKIKIEMETIGKISFILTYFMYVKLHHYNSDLNNLLNYYYFTKINFNRFKSNNTLAFAQILKQPISHF